MSSLGGWLTLPPAGQAGGSMPWNGPATVRQAAFLREMLPENVDLAVDLHGRYDVGPAKRRPGMGRSGLVSGAVERRGAQASAHGSKNPTIPTVLAPAPLLGAGTEPAFQIM